MNGLEPPAWVLELSRTNPIVHAFLRISRRERGGFSFEVLSEMAHALAVQNGQVIDALTEATARQMPAITWEALITTAPPAPAAVRDQVMLRGAVAECLGLTRPPAAVTLVYTTGAYCPHGIGNLMPCRDCERPALHT